MRTFNKHLVHPLYLTCIFVAATSILAGLCLPARAEAPVDETRKNSSAELLVDEEFHPPSGTYFYDVFLGNMRVGKATINVRQKGEEYFIEVSAKTRKVIHSLYKVRYRGETEMTTDPLLPRSTTIEEQTGSKSKKYFAQFPEPNRVTSVKIETKDGKKTQRSEHEFLSESFVLDPFSTIFLIRSLKWQVGDVEVFDIFTGKKHYELQLVCRAETTMIFKGEKRKVWEIIPQTLSLTEPRKIKLSGFAIYLSQDNRREILKITGEPSIGRVVARMRKFVKD